MKIAVFSATGDQGIAQVREAAAQGHEVTAISRNPTRADLPEGVTPLAADYGDHDSLRRAMAGAEAVLLNLPSTSFQAAEPLLAAVRVIAEAAAGSDSLKVLVFNTSMPVPAERMGIAAQDARLEMREILMESGAPVITASLKSGWSASRRSRRIQIRIGAGMVSLLGRFRPELAPRPPDQDAPSRRVSNAGCPVCSVSSSRVRGRACGISA